MLLAPMANTLLIVHFYTHTSITSSTGHTYILNVLEASQPIAGISFKIAAKLSNSSHREAGPIQSVGSYNICNVYS